MAEADLGATYSAYEFLARLQSLMIDIGTKLLQNLFHEKLQGGALDDFLAEQRRTIENLRTRNIITKAQYDLLYNPARYPPNIEDFDITLIICLLRNIPSLGLDQKYEWNVPPGPSDVTVEADICRLRTFRNETAHISSTRGIIQAWFEYKWAELEKVLLRLNSTLLNPVTNFKQTVDDSKHSPLDPSAEQRSRITFEQWLQSEPVLETKMLWLKDVLSNLEQNFVEMKEDIRDLKHSVRKIEQDTADFKQVFAKEKEEDVKNITQEDINARNKRLKEIFESKDAIKGRLKILTAENIKDLLDSCDSKPKYKGGFGDIYVSNTKIPGLNMKMIVKKIEMKNEGAQQTMRSFTNEKLCARSLHFAIVPLLGYREDSNERMFYFLSPYMENESLNKVIEEDNKRHKRNETWVLHSGHRTRILFQIASAIHFLHTPLKDIRGSIIHSDITSLNIVLDGAFNARLIDFGLAREMKYGYDYTKITTLYPATFGYHKNEDLFVIAKKDDYRCFGIVIRELLTGEEAFVEEKALVKQSPKKIKNNLLDMWTNLRSGSAETLVKLSTDCIDKKVSSDEIVKTLKEVLRNLNTPRWENLDEDENLSKKCEMCLESDSVGEKILTHYNCKNNIKVCVSCMRNSYCNPIQCHSCDTTIQPKIGHGWAALLIAGDDSKESVAKTMREDVDAIFEVITSKCPLVMGVRAENVQIVKHVEEVEEKIQSAVKALKKVDDIHTLLVYVSSHFVPEKGGFKLKSEPEGQFLSISELQDIIADVLNNGTEEKRTIVLLDCCYSPSIVNAQTLAHDEKHCPIAIHSSAEVSDTNSCVTKRIDPLKMDKELPSKVPGIRIVQMNACRPNQKTVLDTEGSLFRKLFVRALTGKSLGEPCVKKCPKFQNCFLPGNFVTAEKLQEYIDSHCPLQNSDCVINYDNVGQGDVKIGYVVNFKVDLQVTYRYKDKVDHGRIQKRMLVDLSKLKTELFDKYVDKMGLGERVDDETKRFAKDFYEILCIEVNRGPKKYHRVRLTTIEMVMAAWNAKQELVVTLRTLNEVTDGPVGIFLPPEQTVEPILDILRKEKSAGIVEEVEKENDTTYGIKLYEDFESFSTKVDEQNKAQRSLTTFDDNFDDLKQAIGELKDSEKNQLKELRIIFPCANVNGTRQHRKDFLCYKVVKREDG